MTAGCLIAITVNPNVELNQITGEEVAVDPANRVIQAGVDASKNTETYNQEEEGSAFDPDFKRTSKCLTDPEFQEGASEQDLINFWTTKRALN